ncbi:LppA family lipoprotein [Antribacter sp. KLBMP9083]|uniref:LppA family lipoprotein n=1 Tax=Antribacter soli TaxID=2910976 RepID=A0AA41QBE2_9MICO|nr:LppA family lipoprotein [Antribacter soli]MCF4120348.1 LppA family lipoprotein [Antribacter soli]
MRTVGPAVGLRAVVAAATCSLLVAACSPGPEASRTLDEAPAHYEAALDDVAAAFAGVVGDVDWTADGPGLAEAAPDGLCTYSSPTREAVEKLDVAATGAQWDDVVAAVGPVLADHGFEVVEDGPAVGGWLVVQAEDDAGAVLQLRFKARTELAVSSALVRSGVAGCELP